MHHTTFLLPSAIAAILALAGCGGGDEATDDGSGGGINLRITSASLSSTPGAPVKNTAVTVTVEVANNGSSDSPATTYSYTLDGTTVTTALPAVPAGESIEVSFDVTSAVAGEFPVAVTLDPANSVNERSESDNTASVSVTWSNTSLRNIVVSAASIDDDTLLVGADAELSFTLTYDNASLSGATPVTWRIVRDDDGDLTQVHAGVATPVIGDPLSLTITFDDPGISGEREYILQTDYNDTVPESSEVDNLFAFTITWSAPG
ncbi:MAG: hypothetical protein J0M02_07870 [Planctomycetes bacterium]|nr:hypothetical protein [Planctomycetota bacterium]